MTDTTSRAAEILAGDGHSRELFDHHGAGHEGVRLWGHDDDFISRMVYIILDLSIKPSNCLGKSRSGLLDGLAMGSHWTAPKRN